MKTKGFAATFSSLALLIPAYTFGAETGDDSLILAQGGQQQMQGGQQQMQQQGDLMSMTAEGIKGMKIVDQQGQDIGKVDEVVKHKQDQSLNAVVASGGFLGIGQKKVAVPVSQLKVQGDQLQYQGSKDQLGQMAEYNKDQYESVPKNQQLASIAGPQAGQVSFTQLDQNNDGYISQQEAQGAPQLSQNMQQYDQNQDNRLDRSEFAAFEQEQQQKQQQPQQQQQQQQSGQMGGGGQASFEQLDKDGDQYISQQEAQTNQQLSQNFRQYDADQDNRLDQVEFSAFEKQQQQSQ